ncbi:MAG: thiolase family protein [Parvularculaceae bacterium]
MGNRAHRKGYDGVVVTAPVTIPYERYSPKPAHWWVGRALKALSTRSKLEAKDIDGLSVSSFTLFPDTAVALTQHFGLSPRWLDHIPMGGASGVVALRRAARAVAAGDVEVVACVAGDANHVNSFRNTLTAFSRFSQDASYPYGSGGPNASFALMTRNYMNAYGVTRRFRAHLRGAARQRIVLSACADEEAAFHDGLLAARAVADPVHLFDCVMPCAGAEGFLVMREENARALDLPFARILSTIERHNAFPDDPIQYRGGWALDKDEFWAMAGVSPDAADLETYDDYPVIVMMQIEDLGFCGKGEAAEFVRSRSLTVDGDFPHNTSGGQLSVGQAGAAGGYLGLVEAVRQLTGEALGAQVENAKIAAVSGFGMINFDRGLCTAAAVLASGGGDG